jgi:hypothetical protein
MIKLFAALSLAAATVSFGGSALAATNQSSHSVVPSGTGHHCPTGEYWGRTSTLHRCGDKWCTKYSAYHCIERQAPPK